jgi:hypothetical protein
LGSVDVYFHLGQSRDGKSAGSLRLAADEPTGDMYSPKGLAYPWRRGDVAVVTNPGQNAARTGRCRGVQRQPLHHQLLSPR